MSLHTFGAVDAARAIREKVLSPVDLVEALLKRIETVDTHIQAWALVDRDGARAAARQAVDEAARGVFRGPLHGVPFGAKDIFYSAGLPTEAGSKVMAGFVPDYDATSVARLKAAGAILLGKLHTTEFATSDPAPTRNPWNLACTPGGSSSGSAAAVAARMVPLALGSQTIGSNVRPASYCGLVGLKPTFGRISTRGVMALSYTQDHVGLMARSVEDVALALSVTAGHDPEDPSSSGTPVPDYLAAITRRRPPRIGLLREFFERATPEVADVTSQAVSRLERAGAIVEEAKLPPTFRAVAAAAYLITRSDTASIHAERFASKADLYRPAIRSSIEMGMLIPGDLYVRALRIRGQFRRELGPLLDRYDVLLTPTTPAPAPEGLATGDPQFQIPWSLSGMPSVTVPSGLTTSGLPLGIQLVSGAFTESALLAAAAWCEDVLDHTPAPNL
ncbi:MAG: amidase [Candidatus Rokuibacteriota bacterium]|nr:MAG: amidase [Candidatus Rokubacteria bacterium]